MAMTNARITSMVTAIRLAVENALASESIRSILLQEGYTEASLAEGRTLADALSSRQDATGSIFGAQKDATASTIAGLEEARSAILRYRTKARDVFPRGSSAEAWQALKLDREVPRSTNSLIQFGYGMVDEALKNASILSALEAKGYGEEKLKGIRAVVEKAEASNMGQERTKGSRKGTTGARDEQLEATVRWWSTFKSTARQTLTPEQLSTLQLG